MLEEAAAVPSGYPAGTFREVDEYTLMVGMGTSMAEVAQEGVSSSSVVHSRSRMRTSE